MLATFTNIRVRRKLDGELDGKSGKKFGFFQQDAENFAQVARSTGMVERVPGGLAAPSAGLPGRSGG